MTPINPLIFFSFHFHTFKEGGPSANAGLQGALHLHYNISNTKQKIYIYKITDLKNNFHLAKICIKKTKKKM